MLILVLLTTLSACALDVGVLSVERVDLGVCVLDVGVLSVDCVVPRSVSRPQDISLLRIFQLNHIVLHSHQSVLCVCVCVRALECS